MTMTMTLTEQQLDTEARHADEAYARALTEFHNNKAKGTEHKNAAYSIDAIDTIQPTIKTYFSALVGKRGQHKNEFWWNEVRPVLKAEENSRKKKKMVDTLSNMVTLNMIATLSQEIPYTALAAKMADASFNLLRTEYMDRAEYDHQAKKLFLGAIQQLKRTRCDVFEFAKLADKTRVVRCAPEWKSRVQDAASKVRARAFVFAPMVDMPGHHDSLFSGKGGYLSLQSPLLKFSTKIDGKIHSSLTSFTAQNNELFYTLINAAQDIAYQVNKPLFDIIIKAYNKKKHFAKYPATYKQVEAEMKEEANEAIEELGTIFDVVNASAIKKEKSKAKSKGNSMVGRTKDILSKAKEFKDFERIYFPLYVDQRGRVYTYVHTGSLTYMGGELAKALLVFADKEKLNDDGIVSLFQSLGNCLGFDKHSLTTKEEEARSWFDAHKADFLDGNFEVFFDEQDQFEEAINALAVCVELTAWTKDPEHLSGYVAHRDARCSGSSIIGTLLRDKLATTLTSVVDVVKGGKGKLPDAYMAVSNKGYELNDDAYFKEHAKVLFNRKVWKTPVMTRGSYGATQYTIHFGKKNKDDYFSKTGIQALFRKEKLQAEKAIEFTKLMMKTLDASLPSCSLYLDDICEAADKFIEENGFYKLTAPTTGFPMVRRKNKKEERSLESPCSFDRIQLVVYNYTDELDKNKLLGAVAPDTIHMVDASLLFRVRQLCNFNIATVHDSIGSHPNNTKAVVSSYALAMYELASNKVIENIFEQLGSTAPTVDTLTNEEIEDIKNSQHILA